MGWSEILASFCAALENIIYIDEACYKSDKPIPPHPYESIVPNMNWKIIPTTKSQKITFLHLLEVYINDLIALIYITDPE